MNNFWRESSRSSRGWLNSSRELPPLTTLLHPLWTGNDNRNTSTLKILYVVVVTIMIIDCCWRLEFHHLMNDIAILITFEFSHCFWYTVQCWIVITVFKNGLIYSASNILGLFLSILLGSPQEDRGCSSRRLYGKRIFKEVNGSSRSSKERQQMMREPSTFLFTRPVGSWMRLAALFWRTQTNNLLLEIYLLEKVRPELWLYSQKLVFIVNYFSCSLRVNWNVLFRKDSDLLSSYYTVF